MSNLATLSLKLVADSGFESESEGHRITDDQWTRINRILNEDGTPAPEATPIIKDTAHAETIIAELRNRIDKTCSWQDRVAMRGALTLLTCGALPQLPSTKKDG
jgi:hypothetical protein